MSVSTHACVCAHLCTYVPLAICHTARNCTGVHWISHSCWGQDPELSLAESCAPGFQRLQCRYWSGLGVSSENSTGEDAPSEITRLLVGFSFSQAVGLRTSVPHWVLAKRHRQFLDRTGSSVLYVILDRTIPRKYHCIM